MLHRPSPLPKRIVPLGLGVVVVLFAVLQAEATIKKPIVIKMRAFQPVAEINRSGNVIKFQGTGDTPEVWEVGDRLNIQVTVVQAQTGARAVGVHNSVHGVGNPVIPNPYVLAHAVPGNVRFQPGPAKATAVGSRLSGKQVLSTWTWTSNVTLVEK
jgi:hypothetical protein